MEPEHRPSARAIREDIADGMPRWNRDMAERSFRGTLGMGIGMAGVTLVESLLALAVHELLPQVRIRDKPTIGWYVATLERNGRKRELSCSGALRPLITDAEVGLLREFATCRAAIAHQADGHRRAKHLGRLTEQDVRLALSLVDRVASLPIVDELICLEGVSNPVQQSLGLD